MSAPGQVTIGQWFRLPKDERRCRIANLRAADAELQEYQPPGRQETETYLALNGRVNDLLMTVPWWWRR